MAVARHLEGRRVATLILTAAGTAVGGPIGGAIGALIGQQADAAIFAPKPRQGPRLGELAVQTSSYGTQIPKIFGTMRVAGTVIWATDLRERKSSDGGGKGRPKTVNYSYSASFAVALSGRPIKAVRRIWADGKLLRGASGEFKSRTGYRLHHGGEEQPVDPLIASAEGMSGTPAFRGIAYAMFEDFQLEDYGNRIPSLTFEIVADEQPVTIGAVAEALGGEAVTAGATPALTGYAAGGDSVRGALEALSDVVPLSLAEVDGRLRIGTAAGVPVELKEEDAGARSTSGGGRTEIMRRAAGSVPGEVSIAFYDSARDYQTGLQRASSEPSSLRSDRRTLPAVMSADAAKAFAEYRLAWLRAGRATAKVHLPPRLSGIRPGALIRLEGQAGVWKVERWTLGASGLATLELVRVPGSGFASAPGANPGRPIGHPDIPHGPTTIHLLDLPLYEDQPSNKAKLFVAAAGAMAGWRRAEMMTSYDGGASWSAAGATAAPAVIGTTLGVLGAGGSTLLDLRNEVEIELLNDAMWIEARSDAALVGGANLAVIGDELVQFGKAAALGGRRFRLSRLLRGRRGTEWATRTHAAGEPFVLVETAAILAIEPPAAVLGGEARLLASGLGDGEEGVVATQTIAGETLRPPSPVHLKAERQPNGDIFVSWVRRSRNGWAWLSGSDTPLGEEAEAYRLTLSGAGYQRTLTLSAPAFTYTAEAQAVDGLQGVLSIEVLQLGTAAPSRPAQTSFIQGVQDE